MTTLAVLGGGALGMLLAARLAEAGCPVVLWTRTEEQAAQAAEHGISIEDGEAGQRRIVRVNATAAGSVPDGFDGNVLVTVKQTALTPALAGFLSSTLSREAAVTFFQNGVGHIERMAEALPGRTLLAAVTTEAALRTGPVSVRHTGSGETWIGQPLARTEAGAERSAAAYARSLTDAMAQAGFSVFLSNDIRERMHLKLLINAVINPLTALWRVPNGELTGTPDRLAVMQALFRETADVLFGSPDSPGLWDHVLRVCAATSSNRSSMLQDVLAGRPTEIEALNGAVTRMAASQGKEAPWNSTVTALVKAIHPFEETGQ